MTQPTGAAYAIICSVNDRRYIGSSGNVRARWRNHLYHLRRGTHARPELQADWDKYGQQAFAFVILEEHYLVDEWLMAEQENLDEALAAGLAYNSAPSAYDNTGTVRSEEHKQAISDANRGVPKSGEHRTKLRQAQVLYWAGREVTQEYRDQMAARARLGKGKPKSAETRAKMSAAQKGRQFTPEHIEAIRESKKGWQPKSTKLTEEQAREIKRRLADNASCAALGREFGVSPLTISDIKHGRTWKHIT